MRLRSLFPLAILLLASSVSAANRAQSSQVSISEPITDAFVEEVRGGRNWPNIPVVIEKDADDAALASLVKLPEIRKVTFKPGNEQISKLDPLAELPLLAELMVNAMKRPEDETIDIAPLGRCKSLMKLRLQRLPAKNVDALTRCPRLGDLTIYDIDMDSLAWMSGLKSVVILDLSRPSKERVAGFEALGQLTSLQELTISFFKGISQEDVDSLRSLRGLRKLQFYGSECLFENLNFMSDMSGLQEFELNYARELADIRGLANKPYLREAKFKQTAVSDVSVLSSCVRLEELTFDKTPVADLKPLSSLPVLRSLTFYYVDELTDLSPLANVQTLEALRFQETGVTDLSPLARLGNLDFIEVRKSALRDVAPLAGLPVLGSVNLPETEVSDLSPLYGKLSLQFLTVPKAKFSEEQVAALSAKMPLTKITVR